MYFKFLLPLVLALAATTAVSLPSPQGRNEARIARRVGGAPRSLLKMGDEQNSTVFAGAVINEPPGTFMSVSASFKVPAPYVPEGADPSGNYSAAIVIGIDGDTCLNAFLQAGVEISIDDGQQSITALAEFVPAGPVAFSGICVTAGDVLTVNVTATNATSGTVVIINQSTGESGYMILTSDVPLCQQDAGWLVADLGVSLPDFGTVIFTDTLAETLSGPVDASHANISDIVQNSTFITSVSSLPPNVSVTFI
ncbi:uncharacterized protein PHACADRAFT_140962 [Phanerochaete carnosa HHB-10118-sp]|uniref:Ubiquitin 3 binding protein But2 C-terminal domain-containing protein n=1 Tax=Phanerochaete carnosa (strain HHB-10118-sp) TaxID=650164 RepID=K5WBJ5_PHACS|nr:uncharacterized protein PHACADRAFT_140962 [Phanerochaete carnosa HHB-10118-sp]EKM56329.1 hypothetical protein PHACADRAFT_140962 [Phanerochaete carnosa HHB-10118-sp]